MSCAGQCAHQSMWTMSESQINKRNIGLDWGGGGEGCVHIRQTLKISYRHTLYSHPLQPPNFPSQHVHSRFSSDSRFQQTSCHPSTLQPATRSIETTSNTNNIQSTSAVCSKGVCFFLSSSRDRAASAHRLLTAVRRLTTSRSQPAPSLQASTRRLRLAKDPGCAVF